MSDIESPNNVLAMDSTPIRPRREYLDPETRQGLIDELIAAEIEPLHAKIVTLRGEGATIRETAEIAGCGTTCVKTTTKEYKDAVEAIKWLAKAQIAEMFAERLAEATTARLDDASNVESRTGHASYLAVLRAIDAIDQKPLLQFGDNNFTVDARSINLGGYSEALEAELRAKLG